jgi:miniconductance mechanosensitive channel
MDKTGTALQSYIYNLLYEKILQLGFSERVTHVINSVIILIGVALLLFIADYILRTIIRAIVIRFMRKTKIKFDDYLIQNKVLKSFTHLIVLVLAKYSLPLIFTGFPTWAAAMVKIINIFIILTVGMIINGIFKSLRDLFKTKESFEAKPLDSYMQLVSIVIFSVCGVIIFSLLTGTSPYAFLLSLGAASAVLMLIFKDTILGFVASIQVSANDMVKVGDWVEMPKYGADGDVLSINLNTVKVQNWDKTITTVPTYAFITDSFKNWRGMTSSGGRRIKRTINFKISSFKFCDQQMLQKFKKYRLIKEYILEKEKEIAEFNAKFGDEDMMSVNIRRLTNIGIFRIYAEKYLFEKHEISKEMTTMVRQLDPTSKGLPLEIYCFSSDIRWIYYENIAADIFDHLLTVASEFDLEIFEEPTGSDFKRYLGNADKN